MVSADGLTRPSARVRTAGAGLRRRLRQRRWRAVVIAVVVVVLAFVASTLRLFVFPTLDSPAKADAIVMFDGVGSRKGPTFDLARAGYASQVAISTQDPRFCEANLPTIPGVKIFCFVPSPPTTRGEGRQTAELAQKYGWHSVILVVGRPQATRARIRVDRCYDGSMLVTGVSPPRSAWPKTIVYEWGALLKAELFQRSC